MHTIKEAAASFGRIDSVPEEEKAALDKALRNLTQRHYLSPADRQGRADLYSLPSVCALRLLHVASGLLSDRWVLDALARAMQNQPTGPARRVVVEGGERPMTPIEEAVARVRDGETFDFNLRLFRGNRLGFAADWPDDDPKSAAVADRVFADAAPEEPVATFSLHASRLIREILDDIEAEG